MKIFMMAMVGPCIAAAMTACAADLLKEPPPKLEIVAAGLRWDGGKQLALKARITAVGTNTLELDVSRMEITAEWKSQKPGFGVDAVGQNLKILECSEALLMDGNFLAVSPSSPVEICMTTRYVGEQYEMFREYGWFDDAKKSWDEVNAAEYKLRLFYKVPLDSERPRVWLNSTGDPNMESLGSQEITTPLRYPETPAPSVELVSAHFVYAGAGVSDSEHIEYTVGLWNRGRKTIKLDADAFRLQIRWKDSKLGADYGIEGRLIGNTPTPESPAPDGRWIEVPTNRPVFVALVADRFDVSVAGTHAAARWEHRRTAGYRIRATYKPTRMDEKADPAGWQCLGRCPFEMLASEWIETDLYQRYFVGEAIRNPRQDGRRRIDSEGR